MSEVNTKVGLPLNERFLRRRCPFCRRDFEISMSEEQLRSLGFGKATVYQCGYRNRSQLGMVEPCPPDSLAGSRWSDGYPPWS